MSPFGFPNFSQVHPCQSWTLLLASAPLTHFLDPMSKHNSLKRKGGATGKRSVMKRFERVKLMKERGEWTKGKSAIGLPKTKAEG